MSHNGTANAPTRQWRRAALAHEHCNERGSGTVLMAACCAVALLLTTALGAVASAVVAGHRAQVAADLAAVAAAQSVFLGADACVVAAAVAGRNGTALQGCSRSGLDVQVTVSARAGPVQGWAPLGHVRATGRAGPADSP